MSREFYELFSTVLTPFRSALFARRFGVHQDTVRAWGRPVESDEHPTGTGKRSPFDHANFILAETQKTNPAEAQELIDRLQLEYNARERAAGALVADIENSINAPLVHAIREAADVVAVLASDPTDPQSWVQARIEIKQAMAAHMQLDSCLERLIETNGKELCGAKPLMKAV